MTPQQAFSIIDQATQPGFVHSRQTYVQVEEAIGVIAQRLAKADELEAAKPVEEPIPTEKSYAENH